MNAALRWLSNAFTPSRAALVLRAYSRAFDPQSDARFILEDLSLYCGLRASGFVPGMPDQTAFNEGQRDVLLHILSMADLQPEDLLKPIIDNDPFDNQ